ncbi:autotransporter assembly complex protein TamA [Iodidimonas muriae]|nr:autotransporter assembly complex family protein [Iodidimonas muriae]
MPLLFLMACLMVAGLVPSAKISAQTNGQAAQNPNNIPYDLSLTGITGSLKTRLEELSILIKDKKSPPRSYGALRARLERDLKTFEKALRSEGYYNASISHQIDSSQSPVAITMRIFTGKQYKIDLVDLAFPGVLPEETVVEALKAAMTLAPGDPARAEDIVLAETAILATLPRLGYPLARTATRHVVIDHDTDSARITYRFDTGPAMRFGDVRFDGLETIKEGYLRRLVPWESGAPYDQAQVETFRRTLISSRLFGSVRIQFSDPLADLRTHTEPIAPEMKITVIETDQRTISLGAGFSTSEGFGGDATWEHRNFFGASERLTLTARIAEIEQSLVADIRKPNFLRRDQYLTGRVGAIREDTDAFDSLELNIRAGLDRAIGRYWQFGVATDLSFTDVEENDERRTFLLAALPLSATFDNRDSVLDPTYGLYARLAIAPHLAEQSGFFSFYKTAFDASSYLPLDKDKDILLAARVAVGSIIGAENERLPANRRFFSGGGGSVRGFGFQDVGPLAEDGQPLGGRSLFEASFEARFRIGEDFGVVPFIDVGEVTESTTPRFGDLRWGAGLGFRYYTSFAPIRVDIATPINRRPGDNRIQFYISLGQSF